MADEAEYLAENASPQPNAAVVTWHDVLDYFGLARRSNTIQRSRNPLSVKPVTWLFSVAFESKHDRCSLRSNSSNSTGRRLKGLIPA